LVLVHCQVLLSPFTNLDLTDVTERGTRLEASRRALTVMMKSWAGLIVVRPLPIEPGW
jgi:hypothetical protein